LDGEALLALAFFFVLLLHASRVFFLFFGLIPQPSCIIIIITTTLILMIAIVRVVNWYYHLRFVYRKMDQISKRQIALPTSVHAHYPRRLDVHVYVHYSK
jgi:hypothetical protein